MSARRIAGGALLALWAMVPAAHAASAAAVASAHTLGEIVQCRASFEALAAFNDRVDANQTGLATAPTPDNAVGPTWKVTPALHTLGIDSGVVLMNSRSTVMLVVASAHPIEDLHAMVKREGMRVELEMGSDAIVRKDLDDHHALRAFTLDAGHYAAGCVYDEQTFLSAREARYNATPARRAQKKALQSELNGDD